MLRYRVLARRREPALRRGHAIVLPSEENGSRARRTFLAPATDVHDELDLVTIPSVGKAAPAPVAHRGLEDLWPIH